ncbi:hypothetical protein EVAR_44367_1 [Eumeta japonica]|uniref:Uncharacterized protein n=1 Tax=Eumeta variegata TaxID=151549 RepID=A0A4C1XA55_EUMVA|nr:hypothetical protein EVAR_44367_1 [Eumeta japonica]
MICVSVNTSGGGSAAKGVASKVPGSILTKGEMTNELLTEVNSKNRKLRDSKSTLIRCHCTSIAVVSAPDLRWANADGLIRNGGHTYLNSRALNPEQPQCGFSVANSRGPWRSSETLQEGGYFIETPGPARSGAAGCRLLNIHQKQRENTHRPRARPGAARRQPPGITCSSLKAGECARAHAPRPRSQTKH